MERHVVSRRDTPVYSYTMERGRGKCSLDLEAKSIQSFVNLWVLVRSRFTFHYNWQRNVSYWECRKKEGKTENCPIMNNRGRERES